MENKLKRKATRKIKKFDFSEDDATVSLVGPAVGSAANSYTTLLTKSNKQVSEEFLRKASEITVTMEITEYLRRFYNLWYEDAEVLARSLGFVTAEMERKEEREEEEYEDYYEKMIEEKVSSIKVMKQLHEAENVEDTLLGISEQDYIQFLQDQEAIEKALLQIETEGKTKSESVEKSAEEVTSDIIVHEVKGEGKTSVVKQKKKETKPMTETVHVAEKEVELVEKSQFDSIQKTLNDTQVELKKALEEIEKYRVEKQEAIAKARKEQLAEVAGDKADVLFKACGEASDEIFADVVKALSEMKAQVEKSKMFEEVGAAVEEEAATESPIAKALQARLAKQQ